MRVLTRIDGDMYDILTAGFSNCLFGPGNFLHDHKVLRETKVILDHIINCKYTSKRDARRLIMPCFQASGLDGELRVVKLSAPGLYTIQYIGSIPIPSHVADLSLLRRKCLPRLLYMKVNCTMLRKMPVLAQSVRKENQKKRRRISTYTRSPSNDSETEEPNVRWTRETWFPSPNPHAATVIPSDILY
ncbi:hypothetical protein BDF14DRAFT_1725582 [Spinellus fusiger]|nr:hypothetical protein BDF14DRAFT_1725582 [Spinellus fusiger]